MKKAPLRTQLPKWEWHIPLSLEFIYDKIQFFEFFVIFFGQSAWNVNIRMEVVLGDWQKKKSHAKK